MSKRSPKSKDKSFKASPSTRLPKKADSYYEHRLSAQQEQLIGRAVASWSQLEGVIEEIIWHLLKLRISDGRAVTSHLDAKYKMRLFRELSKLYLTGHQRELFDEVSSRLEDSYTFRNICAHGRWVTVMPDNVHASLSLRDRLSDGDERSDIMATLWPRENMEAAITNISVSVRNLIRLREGISPSPDTRPALPPTG